MRKIINKNLIIEIKARNKIFLFALHLLILLSMFLRASSKKLPRLYAFIHSILCDLYAFIHSILCDLFFKVQNKSNRLKLTKLSVFKEVSLNTKLKGVSMHLLRNVGIVGKSNAIWGKNCLIYPDFFDIKTMRTSEESFPFYLKPKVNGRYEVSRWVFILKYISLVKNDGVTSISLCSAVHNNYAHWVTEILPSVKVLLDEVGMSRCYLYIDNYINKNFLESLLLLLNNKPNVSIVKVLPYEYVKINKLLVIQGISNIPLDLKGSRESVNKYKAWNWNKSAQLNFVTHIYNALGSLDIPSNAPKKIFLLRKSSYRMLINQDNLALKAKKFDYVAIYPETLLFREQVKLFRNAEVIVSSSGAALANVIFNKKKCKIFIITALKWTNLKYWENLLRPYVSKVVYIPAKGVTSETESRHMNITCDEDLFCNILKEDN